ncbi:MAG: hypothetical protein P9M11_07330 [Candidatus Tenebribacter burtonii]|jgi:hypothetical protein|nr:hypothetical protein [Candidatus Tenebribacter burtonii]
MKKLIYFIIAVLITFGALYVLVKTGKINFPHKKYIVVCHLKTDKYNSIYNAFDNFLLYDKELIDISKYEKGKHIKEYYNKFPWEIDKLGEEAKKKIPHIIAYVDTFETIQTPTKYKYDQYVKLIELYMDYSDPATIALMKQDERKRYNKIENYLIKHENSFLSNLKDNLELNSKDYQIEEILITHFSNYPWLLDDLSLINQLKYKYIENSMNNVIKDSIKSKTKYTKTLDLSNFSDYNENNVFKGELNGVDISIPFSKILYIKKIGSNFEVNFKNELEKSILIVADNQSFHGFSNNIRYSFNIDNLLLLEFLN